ncbi:hypothetical protein LXA43DRAFT_628188 [Ganoderma leucocontextum]|nr:hypothetical protein LXA43DRAFT_628188 [Ganoderma leucocontextum]
MSGKPQDNDMTSAKLMVEDDKEHLPLCVASAPFDDPSKADIVLRSSDNVDFYVFGCILAIASPEVFAPMLSLPQPVESPSADGVDKELPIVDVSETSSTLRPILELCYPLTAPLTFASFDHAKDVLHALHKYQILWPWDPIITPLMSHIREHPLRMYAVAVRLAFDDLAQLAAYTSLLHGDLYQYCVELDGISGTDFQRVVIYRKRAVAALSHFSARWLPTTVTPPGPGGSRWVWLTCRGCISHRRNCVNGPCKCGVAQWFTDYWRVIQETLRATPCAPALKQPVVVSATLALSGTVDCGTCKAAIAKDIPQYLELLEDELNKRISEIKLKEN